jgi:hypothetical protein
VGQFSVVDCEVVVVVDTLTPKSRPSDRALVLSSLSGSANSIRMREDLHVEAAAGSETDRDSRRDGFPFRVRAAWELHIKRFERGILDGGN